MKHMVCLLTLGMLVNSFLDASTTETKSDTVREITYTVTLYRQDETDAQWQELVKQAQEISKNNDVVAGVDHLVRAVAGLKNSESPVETDLIVEFSDGTCQYSTETKACQCQNEQGRCGCSKPKPQRCACGGVKPVAQPAPQPAAQPAP